MFFVGPMRQHLDGHKSLSEHVQVKTVDTPKLVYIPLFTGGRDAIPCVNVGDHVYVGTKLGQKEVPFIVPVFSSVSGTVKAIEKHPHVGLKPVDHVVIENDGKYEEQAPLAPLSMDASDEQLLSRMKEAGIIGCGGAGFPAYVKYQAKGITDLIINAVECEPFLTADYNMLDSHMDDLVTGVSLMYRLSHAKVAHVCIKESHPEMIEKLTKAFANVNGVEVHPVPDVYPMGWERVLIREVKHVEYNKLPAEVGCIVSNATTAIAFANAVTHGMPITQKMITVSGDAIDTPCNVIARVGTPFKDVIDCAGHIIGDEVMMCAGGPMMGRTQVSDQVCVVPETNGITLLKPRHDVEVACLRCGRCTDHCPSGLQPVRINTARKANDIDTLLKLEPMRCIECGLCTYVCPSKIAVTEGIRAAKRIVMLRGKK